MDCSCSGTLRMSTAFVAVVTMRLFAYGMLEISPSLWLQFLQGEVCGEWNGTLVKVTALKFLQLACMVSVFASATAASVIYFIFCYYKIIIIIMSIRHHSFIYLLFLLTHHNLLPYIILHEIGGCSIIHYGRAEITDFGDEFNFGENQLHTYKAEDSQNTLVYGADILSRTQSQQHSLQFTVASCSFYEDCIHVWDYNLAIV